MKPDILAIIPARSGSKGIPRKNIMLLKGKPLIYYTIKEASKSKLLRRVIISTEDDEVAEVSKAYGAAVIKRPFELAQDDTPSLPVLQHVIKHLEETESFYPIIIVILQPTSPLRTVTDIDGSILKFLETGCDSVVTVCEAEHPINWIYTLKRDKLMPAIKGLKSATRRQDIYNMYRLNGAVYITRRDIIMKEGRILGKDCRAYIMPPERSVDIDTLLDFKLAELLIEEGKSIGL
ncbi:MAG: acylneuraminate cytidylyltransferase family protein [bacterium]